MINTDARAPERSTRKSDRGVQVQLRPGSLFLFHAPTAHYHGVGPVALLGRRVKAAKQARSSTISGPTRNVASWRMWLGRCTRRCCWHSLPVWRSDHAFGRWGFWPPRNFTPLAVAQVGGGGAMFRFSGAGFDGLIWTMRAVPAGLGRARCTGGNWRILLDRTGSLRNDVLEALFENRPTQNRSEGINLHRGETACKRYRALGPAADRGGAA